MSHKNETSITSRVVCALVASMVTMAIGAQSPVKRPTLVIGIMVEGLNEDNLELLRPQLSSDGFRCLIDNGAILEDVEFGPTLDPTAATAVLLTGATPAVNGIPAARVYDTEKRRSRSILLDPSKMGNSTTETYSPAALLVTTLSDEVRINDSGIGQVYSIAPDAQNAIIMAGHAGNSAMWVNDVDGKWSSTTFYKDFPSPATKRNYSSQLALRIDTMNWTPSRALETYPDLPEFKKIYPFTHRFLRNDPARYKAYKASPKVNHDITELARDYISTFRLGKRDVMDMLSLGYTVAPYPYTRDSDTRIETMDAYLRLDADLAQLFKAVDQGPGMQNTLVFLAGIPARPGGRKEDERYNIPYGEFSPRKAMSLLNMYLIALHGNGEWLNGYHNGHFFLNHKTIKDNNADLHQIRSEVADFLGRMAGVSRVYTIEDIVAGRLDPEYSRLRENISLEHAGDVIVRINPGWEIVEDETAPADKPEGQVERLSIQNYPVFILAPGLPAQRITTPLDARIIAPTVARVLRIRSPNASALSPLKLKF